MSFLRFGHYIVKSFPLLFIGNVLFMGLTNITNLISVLISAPLLDIYLNPDLQNASDLTIKILKVLEPLGIQPTLVNLLGIFLSFHVLKTGFSCLVEYLILTIRYTLIYKIWTELYADMFNARWQFFSSSRQGVILNSFNREVFGLGTAFVKMATLAVTFLEIACYLSVPFYISWQVTSISLAVAAVIFFPFFFLGKVNYRLGQRTLATANELGVFLQESLGAAKIIMGFGNRQKTIETMGSCVKNWIDAVLRSNLVSFFTRAVHDPLGMLVIVIALFFANRLELPLSETAVLFLALRQVVSSIGVIAPTKNDIMKCLASYEQLDRIRGKARNLRVHSGANTFIGFKREILITNLTFAYPGREPALRDINIRIPKGKMVALVGESGGGKSTLVDMILGLNEPQRGRILFDDTPLRDLDIASYHQRIGFVPQEAVLFNMTVRENLLWAKLDATEEEIEASCRQANAHEFILGLPEGYDTRVGDRGVRLSGGQCQRVALARAILRTPELLILDEATSSLDTQSERLIQKAIEQISRTTTVFVIAHRLSTIVNADYLYVLDKGQIVEEGEYQELVAKDGRFNRMIGLQDLASEVK